MAQNDISNEEIVGFESETEKLIQYLIRDTKELDVVPIVGMGGQGKTTIARKMYNNDMIVSHFDVRAWCIISNTYNRRELLQEIFSQVTGSKDKGDKDDILADKLRKSLMGKRYLIVLDDMWDGMAWDDLSLCFPDVGNRSRIFVTTRLEKVGEHVKRYTDPYSLPFLPLDESCQLLQKKVFQQEGCPPELQDVSLELAEKCKGLPLVIILVAGIIKRNKMEASWWHEVKNSLLSYLGESEGYSLSTMHLSYDNLSDYLKPCLLYMGMFPEDARIPVSKLISLWIAECFVQNVESGRLMEEIAEGYLMDLISSNVVMVSKREYNGKVKYCQVHDVVLHFCLEKSREEEFMLAVKSRFQASHWKESRVSFSFKKKKLFHQHLSNRGGFSNWNPFNQCSKLISKFASPGSKTQKPFHQDLRSLITTNQGGFSNWNFLRKVSEMRLLRVLDLSSHRVDRFSSLTLKPLIHLKYLAVYTNKFHFHPESHLPHLETLVVECTSFSKSTLLPAIFWKMEKLRHVEITRAEFDLEEDKQGRIFEVSSKLENLTILRHVTLPIDSVDVLVRRCPNLQQLHIMFESNDFSAEPFCAKLESLSQLQSLRLCFEWSPLPSELHLPSNLKKLALEGIALERVISFAAGLPCLEYLQVRERIYGGRIVSLRHDVPEQFPIDITLHKLKFLVVSDLAISRWDASGESFPLLETLVIKWCEELEDIPLSFADIPTLKQIKLLYCNNKSLNASATRIKEELKAIEGCDRIDLIIKVSRNKLLSAVFEYLRASNLTAICLILLGPSLAAVSQGCACNHNNAAKADRVDGILS